MSGNLFLSIDFGSTPSTDTGTRPYVGANVLWNNTSIWMDGGPTQTQTRVGTPTTVRVRVSNSGDAPVEDVKVKAYVMNPHIGITTPSQAIATLSGTATADIGPGSTSSPRRSTTSSAAWSTTPISARSRGHPPSPTWTTRSTATSA